MLEMICLEKYCRLTKAKEQRVHTHGVDVKKATCDHERSNYHRLKE